MTRKKYYIITVFLHFVCVCAGGIVGVNDECEKFRMNQTTGVIRGMIFS